MANSPPPIVDGHAPSPIRPVRKGLYIATWLTDFMLALLVFTVSRYLAETGAGLTLMGMVGATHAFGAAAGSFVFGHLSDRIGRRPLVLTGIALLILSAVGCAGAVERTEVFVLFYWLSGPAIGMVYPPIIACLSPQDVRERGASRHISSALIRFCISWNLGLIAGQLGAGYLFPIDPRWPAVLAAGLGVLNMTLILGLGVRGMDAAKTVALDNPEPTDLRALSEQFRRLSWIANVGGAFSVGMVFHLFPNLAVALGVPPEHHGTMLALMRFTAIAVYFCMHRSAFWHYRFSVAVCAQSAAVCGLLLLICGASETALTAGLCGLGIMVGYNYFASLYYSSTGTSHERKGWASGIHEATLGFGLALGSLTGGAAGRYGGSRAPYGLALAVILLLAALQTMVYVRRVRPLR